MATRSTWIPKRLIKCSMCDSNHGHQYKIVESGIWWENGPAYQTYRFCSICFTVLNKLWPSDTELVHNKKVIEPRNAKSHSVRRTSVEVEASRCDHRDSLDYLIKHNPDKYNKFIEERDYYINYLFSNCKI